MRNVGNTLIVSSQYVFKVDVTRVFRVTRLRLIVYHKTRLTLFEVHLFLFVMLPVFVRVSTELRKGVSTLRCILFVV